MYTEEFDIEITESIFPFCKERRETLIKLVKASFNKNNGKIIVFGNFETHDGRFVQDSNFYYLSGIEEPGCILEIDLETKKTTLYIPAHHEGKLVWTNSSITLKTPPMVFELDQIQPLGIECHEIMITPTSKTVYFEHFFNMLKLCLKEKKSLFLPLEHLKKSSYAIQLFFEKLQSEISELTQSIVDISPLLTQMRMKKSEEEISRIFKAIDVTSSAHEMAMTSLLEENATESEVHATLEFAFTANNCLPAFPSIVASGKNATILHYHQNNASIKKGDLVVIDIGARFEGYCADLTRTYPSSGKFNKRQKELYEIVLEIQAKIADIAKPGFFINNKEKADISLQHIAINLFKEKNLEKYFVHGIGHQLGLDVHDVSDYSKPLEIGNVITIEPGLYIKEENIGIRIEDNYMITENGAACLSEDLPKLVEEIESFMRRR